MKPLVITPVTLMTTCDVYMCPSMAKHSIASPDAPPGMCFRMCDDHLESLRGLLAAVPPDMIAAPQEEVAPHEVEAAQEVAVPQVPAEEQPAEPVVNVFATAHRRSRKASVEEKDQ